MADSKVTSFVHLELNDTQNLAIQEFFDSTITKTMVDVKLAAGPEGNVNLQFLEELTPQGKQALVKAFFIGYNTARIELGS